MIGGAKWGNSNQLDFGYCNRLDGAVIDSSRWVVPPERSTADHYCNNDEIVCGGKNSEGKNDNWGSFYCCRIELGTLEVRAERSDEDGDPRVLFNLVGLTLPPSTTTPYINSGGAPFRAYTLTVPQSTLDRFPGYACNVQNSLTGAATPCAQGSSATLTQQSRRVVFTIRFSRTCRTCQDVVSGGAQCGTFPSGCEAAGEQPSLQCGTCPPPDTCNPQGRCVSPPLVTSCTAAPTPQDVGAPVQFTGRVASGGRGPFTCTWSSTSPQIQGETTCGSFTAVFTNPGRYIADFRVVDSGYTPPQETTATCMVDINPPPTPRVYPPASAPSVDICQAWRVLVLYGIPLTAIMILISGIYLLLSLGVPERVSRGKAALMMSVAGFTVLLFAKPIFVSAITFLGFRVLLCGVPIP